MARPLFDWRLAARRTLAAVVLTLTPTLAQAAEPVDVELVLAVDVSLSMSPFELDIQRRGYAAALTDQQVIRAIEDGPYGKIAVTYFEWAGSATHKVVVPWTAIASRADAEAFVAQLTAMPPSSARRTSISSALEFASDLLAESGFRGMKRVIDISGDGPNNQGPPVVEVRDAVAAQGITINGLPLMTTGGFASVYDVMDLDAYYTNCVIGGPGAFMVPVNDWSQFPEAIRRKLVMELAGLAHPIPAAWDGHALPLLTVQDEEGYDCLIGEKMWRDRSYMWDQR
jgi:hypothetical protein